MYTCLRRLFPALPPADAPAQVSAREANAPAWISAQQADDEALLVTPHCLLSPLLLPSLYPTIILKIVTYRINILKQHLFAR